MLRQHSLRREIFLQVLDGSYVLAWLPLCQILDVVAQIVDFLAHLENHLEEHLAFLFIGVEHLSRRHSRREFATGVWQICCDLVGSDFPAGVKQRNLLNQVFSWRTFPGHR